MASRSASHSSLSQLWQMPLLLASLGLFGYATYLLWDPTAPPTVDQRLDVAKKLLSVERPEAAVEQLNSIIKLDKLTAAQKSRSHALMAEGIEQYQDQKKIIIPALQTRIVYETRQALMDSQSLDAAGYRRVAKAFESLGQTAEALDNYKHAAALDPDRSLRLAKKVIELELQGSDTASADAELKEYIKSPGLTDAEKCWALGERAQVLTDLKQYVEARILLGQALKLSANTLQEGEINYRTGYVSYNLGEFEDAERSLRIAREQFRGNHPMDADACLLLGKIYQSRNQADMARSFFKTILTDFPESKCVPLAQLGMGMCRAALREDDGAVADLTALTKQVDDTPRLTNIKDDVVAGLRQAGGWMGSRGNAKGALDLMAAEQLLSPEPAGEFFGRLSEAFETRATQVEASLADAAPAERIKRTQQVRELRHRAADAAVIYSQKQTLADDKAYADSLWRGIDLYERAGDTPAAISSLELFVTERPSDPLAPDALLRLGQAYRSVGQFDKAIAAYQKNQTQYPKSLAASKTAVPLAMAYAAKGPDYYGKAQTTLESVIDNNPLLDPSSEEYKQALFELGQLGYRAGRYEQAIVRLDEFAKRYPKDDRFGQVLFLTADSYRKSAQQLSSKLSTASTADPGFDPRELTNTKRDRLGRAKTLYDAVVDKYRDSLPSTDTEKLYDKLAHFYRADCLYDLGEYEKAIPLYDNAAFRFQDDPSALAAYVQIVNSWCRLGKPEQAKAANERAKWVLRRIPPEAFANGSFSMPKEYWEQWLKWANESGMW
ncbi:MAG: hypothetical protein JWM57_1281 [Phycisphaerales bacterium]|nr:hypothetical protein [Phycisphaerales bacterium]